MPQSLNRRAAEQGFGLLMAVMMILGVTLTAAIVYSSSLDRVQRNNIAQTQLTLRRLALSISSKNVSPAPSYQRAYEQDVGALPTALNDLAAKPSAVAACTYQPASSSFSGWCGPYWSVPYSGQNNFTDSWNNTFVFDASGRRVYSIGPNGTNDSGVGDDMVQAF